MQDAIDAIAEAYADDAQIVKVCKEALFLLRYV